MFEFTKSEMIGQFLFNVYMTWLFCSYFHPSILFGVLIYALVVAVSNLVVITIHFLTSKNSN